MPTPSTPSAALTARAAAQADPMRAAGIERIVVRSGWLGRTVQVRTGQGAIYFRWPRAVPFVALAIDVDAAGVTVLVEPDAPPAAAGGEAALDFAIRESLRRTRDRNAMQDVRERARH